jgi:hypothetical protein
LFIPCLCLLVVGDWCCLAGGGRELIACINFAGNWKILPDLGWTGVVGHGTVSGV